jgi:adenylate cyclase
MDHAQREALAAWVTAAGLAGESETTILAGFCTRAVAAGLPLARVTLIVDTLHPVYEGRAFIWNRASGETKVTEYAPTQQGEALARWQRSPLFRLFETGEPLLHRLLTAQAEHEFPIFAEYRADGMTGYIAMVNRFAAAGVIGEMDCIYSALLTDAPEAFGDADIADLQRLVPGLALAVKAVSLGRIAGTLVETYLGRDAGRRVLSGRIGRGVADRIEAVLWFSDLRGFTRIADTAAPDQVIPFLNDYAGAVVSAIHEQGGDVLKLIGDGVLAIFTGERRDACRAALAAVAAARLEVAALSRRRAAEALPVTEIYLGLHVGEVFYGNIGSKDRLDFTVVGPAVNEVSRIAALCRSVEQPVLLSSSFAATVAAGAGLVSVGRYALRGVRQPQELFTLEPD